MNFPEGEITGFQGEIFEANFKTSFRKRILEITLKVVRRMCFQIFGPTSGRVTPEDRKMKFLRKFLHDFRSFFLTDFRSKTESVLISGRDTDVSRVVSPAQSRPGAGTRPHKRISLIRNCPPPYVRQWPGGHILTQGVITLHRFQAPTCVLR